MALRGQYVVSICCVDFRKEYKANVCLTKGQSSLRSERLANSLALRSPGVKTNISGKMNLSPLSRSQIEVLLFSRCVPVTSDPSVCPWRCGLLRYTMTST